MTRNEAIELLEKYNEFLEKEGYADDDLWCEPPTAIDGFLGTEWAKEKLPIVINYLHVDMEEGICWKEWGHQYYFTKEEWYALEGEIREHFKPCEFIYEHCPSNNIIRLTEDQVWAQMQKELNLTDDELGSKKEKLNNLFPKNAR
jgi:hypothetical protein